VLKSFNNATYRDIVATGWSARYLIFVSGLFIRLFTCRFEAPRLDSLSESLGERVNFYVNPQNNLVPRATPRGFRVQSKNLLTLALTKTFTKRNQSAKHRISTMQNKFPSLEGENRPEISG